MQVLQLIFPGAVQLDSLRRFAEEFMCRYMLVLHKDGLIMSEEACSLPNSGHDQAVPVDNWVSIVNCP